MLKIIMFYNDPKFKVNFLKVNNPGKSIPFSGLPKKSLDSKPLRFSKVSNYIFDFIEINLKVLVPVQPFGQGNPCILQRINPGQATEKAGNNQNICSKVWCFESYQSDGFEIPPKKTIRFAPHQKPFKKYHIKRSYQIDVLIIPFSFTIFLAHTNHTYTTCYLLFFVDGLRCHFECCPVAQNDNQPLTFEHIKVESQNDKKRINLIYAPTFDKQFHSLSMTNHSLSIIFSHFLMIGNDKFYLHILYVHINISHLVYVYIIYGFYGFKPDKAKRGFKGDSSPFMYI